MPTTPPETPDWLARGRQVLADTPLGPDSAEIGRIEALADGIARVSGLPGAVLNERLRFANDQWGFVLTLDENASHVVLLDPPRDLAAGDTVHRTGDTLRVPVGPALLGRVIDPLGRALDGLPAPQGELELPIDRPAPAIIDRERVTEPLETGVLLVDALFPIGRGQRELIIGDRATGKTSLAVDALIHQTRQDVISVYVAVGQRAAAVNRVIEAVRRHGDMQRCIVVAASASSAPGLQWAAPFAGFSIAEYFRDRGQHALVVIDDLTEHAATHRELALLTHQPPGREAYPGDIFYLHARLLERAARLGEPLGGGSLTALPIARTEAGNLAGYIPTNLISITDGQLVLASHLAAANQHPAVDVGLSVSRVGGKAQPSSVRKAAGTLRLDYAQFLEVELFTRFGGLGDEHLRRQIERGRRIRALLTQPRYTPLARRHQLALLAALADGVLDAYPPERLAQLAARLPEWLDGRVAVPDPGDDAALSTPEMRQALVAAVASLCESLSGGEAEAQDGDADAGTSTGSEHADQGAPDG